MKLLRLDLLAVGPFTGTSLDLSADPANLHVVVGPNEAGKSSALRAIASLLFGFGQRTAGEDAVHKTGDVRVGGLLRHSDASELAVVRRRGTAKTLLDGGDGKTPLRDDALSRFLGTVDRATFDGFFGLGHESLRAGADDLLRTDGQVGRALFSAGAGGKPLRVALDRYLQQAAELYVPSGKLQALPKAFNEFKEALKATTAASLPPEAWVAERAAYDEAHAETERVRAELATVISEQSRLDRLRRAIPLLAERQALRAEVAELADAPLLPTGFPARRAAAEQARTSHARELADARRRLDAITAELDAVQVPEPLLARSEAVDDLYGRLKLYRRAEAAIPALRVRLDAAVATAGRMVLDLRPGEAVPAGIDGVLAAADGLRLGTGRRNRINELAAAYERLAERQASSARAVVEAAAARARQAADLEALPPPVDVSATDAAVRAATRAGDIDKLLADARAAEARDRATADNARRALPLVAGDVEALPVPSAASVEGATREHAVVEADHARIAAEVGRLQQQLTGVDRERAALEVAGHVPTEAELAAARGERDALWAATRSTRRVDDPQPYEAAVDRADDVADALRRESTRVARQAQLTFERHDVATALAAGRDELAAVDGRRAVARERWLQLWSPAGIEPLSPGEMRDWLSRHADACRAAGAARVAAAVVASLGEQVASHRAAVAAALGLAPVEGPLAPLLERARAVVETAREADERRQRAEALLRAGAADADRRAADVGTAEADLVAWQEDWASAVAGLGLPAGAGPAEARSTVQRSDELLAAADDVRRLHTELAAAEAEVGRFVADAAVLAEAVGADTTGPADAVAAQLRQAVEFAQQEATRRTTLRKQRALAAVTTSEAESAAAAAADELAELCRIAGCEFDDLPSVERRSAQRHGAEVRLKQKERELLTLNHGEAIDTMAAEAATTDEATLALRLAELDGRAAALEGRRRELDQRIGRASANLDTWTGGDAAAEAADRAQMVLARAREAAGRYVRLRLAAGVLRQGIERHRQRKQAPLLRRASQLFCALTLGSFSAMDVEFGDGDQPVLVGVRGGDGRATVGQMSDGTRDQLYLSLRLAALEDFAGRNEPVPLVVDDVLVHFDDARSTAALAALADLSRLTQVVLFTHHERVAELARSAAGEALVIHRL